MNPNDPAWQMLLSFFLKAICKSEQITEKVTCDVA